MDKSIKGITIKVGGDTTGLDKALNDVNKTASSTERQLRDVDKALRFDPKNTTLLSEKQQLLAKDIEATKSKLDILRSAQAQVKEQYAKGEIDEGAYRSFQIELGKTEAKLTDLKKQSKELGNEISRSLDNAKDHLDKFSEKVESAGKKMSVISGALAAGGTASTKMAMDFEDAMAKVYTIADESAVSMEDMSSAILALSDETGVASTDIANNVYDAISAGQSTADAVDFVAQALKLSKSGFTESASALDILTTTLNAYKMESSEAGYVSDILIGTQNLGKTTVDQLSASMGKIIPTANSYGVALDQLATGYAVMTANGVATAESTTYMNSMLNELGKSGTGVSNALKEKTGKSFKELMEDGYSLADVLSILQEHADESDVSFNDLWSSAEAGKAGLILLGTSTDEFNGKLDQMREMAGATDTAYEKLDTTSNKINKSINRGKNAAIDLGQTILTMLSPLLDKLSDKIKALTSWFSGLTEEEQKTIVKVLGVVAAIGPLLIIMGQVSTGISGIIGLLSFLASNPIVLLIAAISLVIGVLVTLYNTNEDFRNKVNEVWGGIREYVGECVDDLCTSLTGILEFFTVKIPDGLDYYAAYWKGVWKDITDGAKLLFYDFQVWYVNTMNDIIDGINMIGLDFSWMGIDQSVGFNLERYRMPSPPQLASGGVVSSGSAIIAEAGPELLTVMNGRAVVQPLSPTASNAPAAQAPESQTFVLMLPDYKVLASGTAKYQDAIAGETIRLKTRTRL